MMFRHGSINRRDAFLLLIGASSMHIWSLLFSAHADTTEQAIVINTHVGSVGGQDQLQDAVVAGTKLTMTALLWQTVTQTETQTEIQTSTATTTATATATVTQPPRSLALASSAPLPPTEILAHAPGWTLFRNIYMSNGTLFVVADEDAREDIPEIRMMTSVAIPAVNTPENIAAREPTGEQMQIISPAEARKRWMIGDEKRSVNRVWTVEGNTFLFNDPSQFLRHYYHLVAELFFGAQAFWHGAFAAPLPPADALSPDAQTHYALQHAPAPPVHRAIFAHSNADGWRDNPDFNAYFLRAALPSLAIEHQEDWADRVRATKPQARPRPGSTQLDERAWHFPMLLLADRSAAHRGVMCGSNTQRTASEAWDYMRLKGKLRGLHVGGWWAPLREAVWRFAGVDAQPAASADGITSAGEGVGTEQVQGHFFAETGEVRGLDGHAAKLDPVEVANVGVEHQRKLPLPERVVISYISRQSAHNRKLIVEDHGLLVESLKDLVAKKNGERQAALAEQKGKEGGEVPLEWELIIVEAENLSHDEQIRMAARTTIMLGVHGNGLTHLVFMKPSRLSTVIEMFYPGGFAHDYYWTSRALGMSHFAVWNDTHRAYPNKPDVYYPDGFQGNAIPVHGPSVIQLIEDRVALKL